MKIEKGKLLEIIQKVMPAVEKKGVVEEMGHLVFDNNWVLTYNDKIAISYPIPIEELDFKKGVVASDFLAAVKGIKTKDINLNPTEHGLVVYGGKSNTILPYYDENKIMELHDSLDLDAVQDKFVDLPAGFLDGLRVCKYAATDNLDNPKGLFCVKVTPGQLFATDGYQATRYPIDEVDLKPVFIQKTFIDPILAFNPVTAAFTKTWAFFSNDDYAILSCRTANVFHTYPENLDNIFPEFDSGFKFTEDLDDELTSLEFFSEGSDKADKSVEVTIDPDGTCQLAAGSQRGSSTVETQVTDFEGKVLQFVINPGALRECIAHEGMMQVSDRALALRTKTFAHIAALKVVK